MNKIFEEKRNAAEDRLIIIDGVISMLTALYPRHNTVVRYIPIEGL